MDHRDVLGTYFDFIHAYIKLIQHHVRLIDDPYAVDLSQNLEQQTLAALRKLRLRLKIPYSKENENDQKRNPRNSERTETPLDA
jgi:hypothetical protein